MNSIDALRQARYISLATFRTSGLAVATPVWAASDGGVMYVFSAGGAGKVKRLRNSDKVRLAVCDARGKLLGEWRDATAEIVSDAPAVAAALAALRKKYGWQMWLADVGAKFTAKFNKRCYIRIQLKEIP